EGIVHIGEGGIEVCPETVGAVGMVFYGLLGVAVSVGYNRGGVEVVAVVVLHPPVFMDRGYPLGIGEEVDDGFFIPYLIDLPEVKRGCAGEVVILPYPLASAVIGEGEIGLGCAPSYPPTDDRGLVVMVPVKI
ncbi:MAG TPA: hypothetical protein DD713_06915, partial [Nitrospiraceae bacterium]|nr:hypothetical protein [Nitrospiraceae bacterium]